MFARDPTPEQVRIDRRLRLTWLQLACNADRGAQAVSSKVAVNHQHIPSSHSITSSRSGLVPLFQTRLRSSPSQWRTFIYLFYFVCAHRAADPVHHCGGHAAIPAALGAARQRGAGHCGGLPASPGALRCAALRCAVPCRAMLSCAALCCAVLCRACCCCRAGLPGHAAAMSSTIERNFCCASAAPLTVADAAAG